jgi:hypothetical protein
MKPITSKQVLFLTIGQLLVFAFSMSVYGSVKDSELNLIGVIAAIYYCLPAILFNSIYLASLNALKESSIKHLVTSIFGQVLLSMTIGLLVLTLWVLVDGESYNYDKTNPASYWFSESKNYLIPLIYFGVTSPIIIYIIAKEKVAERNINGDNKITEDTNGLQHNI